MISPKLKSLASLDLKGSSLPDDPENCCVNLEALIGTAESEGGDRFSFVVITPSALISEVPRWGRGLLIVQEFSWSEIHRFVERLILRAARPTWSEVAVELSKDLNWEFENYQCTDA